MLCRILGHFWVHLRQMSLNETNMTDWFYCRRCLTYSSAIVDQIGTPYPRMIHQKQKLNEKAYDRFDQ